MDSVTDWIHRLTAYGWLDLGGHALVATLVIGLLWDLERLIKRISHLEAQLDPVDENDDVQAGRHRRDDGAELRRTRE